MQHTLSGNSQRNAREVKHYRSWEYIDVYIFIKPDNANLYEYMFAHAYKAIFTAVCAAAVFHMV